MKRHASRDTTASFLEDLPKKRTDEGNYTVVKRNGMMVPFNRERIYSALTKAFQDTKKTQVLDSEQEQTVQRITDLVVKQLLSLASKGTCLTVEGIQDLVEVTLMKHGCHDVARDYIIYRDSRKAKRENALQNIQIYRSDKSSTARFNAMKIAASI